MGKREVIKKLRLYKLLVSGHFDLDKLILFGSYAKGTQRTDSDIDVAVVVNSIDGDFFSYAPLLWKLRLFFVQSLTSHLHFRTICPFSRGSRVLVE